MARVNQEEGRYRVLLVGIGENTPEEKESFSQLVSKTYTISFPLLRRIVDRSPIVLKKNLSRKKAEMLAKTLKTFGATISVEERRNDPPVSLEFEELVPYRLALESACIRRTQRGIWSLIGRARNISDEPLTDTWVLVQLFNNPEELIGFEETPLAINPLPAGEISPFRVILEGDSSVRRVSVAFKNASGEPVPTLDQRKKMDWVQVEIDDGPSFSSSWVDAGFGGKSDSVEPAEIPEKTVPGIEQEIPSELLSSEPEQIPPLLLSEEPEEEQEGSTERIPEQPPSLILEPSEEIFEPSPGPPRVDLSSEKSVSERAAGEGMVEDEALRPEQPGGTTDGGGAAVELKVLTEEEEPDSSRLDVSVFEEATRLLEDISEGPGEVKSAEEIEKGVEEQLLSFPWIEHFRDAVRAFYQRPKDIFSIWFEERRKEGELKEALHAVLTILVHSRFDQGSRSIKALENTQRVCRLVAQSNLLLDEIPRLEETPFISGEVWRELFHRALPKIQQIGRTILERNKWKGFELERLIQVIPHMGHRNSRLAARWLSGLIPDVVEIDFSDTPVTVEESFYRVASRLGIIDPHFDHYQGTNSMANVKIQSFSKTAYPQNPLEVEEPMDWTGGTEERGGHCFPVRPRCEGCLFESFCPKLYISFDPAEKGMRD